MEQREAEREALWEDEEWTAQWDKHPGFEGYLHMSVRFLEEAWPQAELGQRPLDRRLSLVQPQNHLHRPGTHPVGHGVHHLETEKLARRAAPPGSPGGRSRRRPDHGPGTLRTTGS